MQLDNIKIPQISYDIIARILPGFFILTLIILSSTVFVEQLEEGISNTKSLTLLILGAVKFEIGFFDTVTFLIISYILGWVFYKPDSKIRNDAREEVISEYNSPNEQSNKIDKQSLRDMYNSIKMTNYSVGQRIVKRRAEIRLWEAIRHARVALLFAFILISIFSYCIASIQSGSPIFSLTKITWINISWSILKITLLLVIYNLNHIKASELKRKWKQYWNEIILNHNLLKKAF